MAAKKTNTDVKSDVQTNVQNVKTVTKYGKHEILASAKYSNRKDLLTVLLDDNKNYTTDEVDKIMNDWLKEGVK